MASWRSGSTAARESRTSRTSWSAAKRSSSMLHAGAPSNGSSTASGRYSKRSLAAQQVDAQLVLAEERAQGEARLEAGDAAAGDDDAGSVGLCHGLHARRRRAAPHRGLPAARLRLSRSVRPSVATPRAAPAPRVVERVGEQLVGVLLGDPGRRAEALRSACEARVVVEPHDDDRHVGVARAQARGGRAGDRR